MAIKTWTHGSHGSHSSHSLHGVHSVHSLHNVHSSHSSTDSHSNTISYPTLSPTNHSSTIGDSSFGSFDTNTKLGVYGGTGSLKAFSDLVTSLRSRITSTSYTDNTSMQVPVSDSRPSFSPTSGAVFNAASVQNLISAGRGTFNARYQPYTLTVNATASGTSTTTNTGSNGSKTQTIDGTITGTLANTSSWTRTASGLAAYRSSYTLTDSLAGNIRRPTFTTGTSISWPVAGSKISKGEATAILASLRNEAVVNYTGPSSVSYTFSGTTKVTHSNHSSHSQHASHVSHASHSSHSQYGS